MLFLLWRQCDKHRDLGSISPAGNENRLVVFPSVRCCGLLAGSPVRYVNTEMRTTPCNADLVNLIRSNIAHPTDLRGMWPHASPGRIRNSDVKLVT